MLPTNFIIALTGPVGVHFGHRLLTQLPELRTYITYSGTLLVGKLN